MRDEQLKIELLSQWKLEAEFRNYFKHCLYCFCLSQKTALVMENARVSDGKPDIFL